MDSDRCPCCLYGFLKTFNLLGIVVLKSNDCIGYSQLLLHSAHCRDYTVCKGTHDIAVGAEKRLAFNTVHYKIFIGTAKFYRSRESSTAASGDTSISHFIL